MLIFILLLRRGGPNGFIAQKKMQKTNRKTETWQLYQTGDIELGVERKVWLTPYSAHLTVIVAILVFSVSLVACSCCSAGAEHYLPHQLDHY